MFAISINYKTAEKKFREPFGLREEQVADLLESLEQKKIREAVYLSTCNRCELYGTGEYDMAMQELAHAAGADLSQMREKAFVFEGKSAVRHLFRVAAGLDSMVIGEDEILGQLRRAYVFSKDLGHTAYQLNTVFQAAITSAKKIKTDTLLSKSSVSTATLVAAKCHQYSDQKKNILFIGASGEIGSKTVKDLISYGDCSIVATAHRSRISSDKVKIIPYEKRYEYADWADIVISATKSPHYTITLTRLLEQHPAEKKRLFIDMAVPGDIDDHVCQMPETELLTMDDFDQIARKHNEQKKAAVKSAEDIMDEIMDDLLKELEFHRFFPHFQRMCEGMPDGFDRFVYRYRKAADYKEFSDFLSVLCRMEESL